MTANNRFRNILPFVVPRWLSTDDGEKVLFTLGMLKDAATERLRQGLEARFPTRASGTALALIGDMRGIPRGRDETNPHYAARLKAWRYPRGHRVRGNAFALLEQVSEYFGGVKCWTIDTKGSIASARLTGLKPPTTEAPRRGIGIRYRPLFGVDSGSGSIHVRVACAYGRDSGFRRSALYGGALGDDDYTIGQTGVTAYDVEAIHGLFGGKHPWYPLGTRPEWVIIQLDGTEQTPDATWENWSKDNGTHKIPSRYTGWRYWSMRPATNNTYAGTLLSFTRSCAASMGRYTHQAPRIRRRSPCPMVRRITRRLARRLRP